MRWPLLLRLACAVAHVSVSLQPSGSTDLDDLELVAVSLAESKENDHAAIADGLWAQLKTVGFLKVTDVEGFDEAALLAANMAVHALPADTKQRLYRNADRAESANLIRGYIPIYPNDPSHKEMFDQGMPLAENPSQWGVEPQQWNSSFMYEATPYPGDDQDLAIRGVLNDHFRALEKAGRRILGYLALKLGKRQDFFEQWFEQGSLSTLRHIHYKPRTTSAVDDSLLNEEQLRMVTPPHTDSGLLTMLSTFGFPGLQVRVCREESGGSPEACTYKAVRPLGKNELVVNVGAVLARLSGYQLQATYHRVLDIGTERYSSPFFLDPAYAARIGALSEGTDGKPRLSALFEEGEWERAPVWSVASSGSGRLRKTDDAVLYGDLLLARLKDSFVEWSDFEVPDRRARAAVERLQKGGLATFDQDPNAKRGFGTAGAGHGAGD